MENILNGVNFMIIGVITVFLFLWLMIAVIGLMRRVIVLLNKYFPEKSEPSAAAVSAPADKGNEIALAITATYINKNKKV